MKGTFRKARPPPTTDAAREAGKPRQLDTDQRVQQGPASADKLQCDGDSPKKLVLWPGKVSE
jgi:hypothetical protein